MKPNEQMTPAEWLEDTRRKYCPQFQFQLKSGWLDDFVHRLPIDKRQKAREVWLAREGRSVYEIHDELMDQYEQHFASALNTEEANSFEKITIALLPTMQFEAYTGWTPRGDPLIVFHQALGYTINFWSHWYLRLHEEGNSFLFKNVSTQAAVLADAIGIWEGNSGHAVMADRFPTTADSWELQDHLTFASLVFVLGHELGHHMMNHKGYSNDQTKNHQMEFDADAFSMRIIVRYALRTMAIREGDSYYGKFALFAPFFVLNIFSLFVESESITHPSPRRRAETLSRCIKATIEETCRDKTPLVLEHLDDFHNLLLRNHDGFDAALSVFKPTFCKAYLLHAKSAKKWISQTMRVSRS